MYKKQQGNESVLEHPPHELCVSTGCCGGTHRPHVLRSVAELDARGQFGGQEGHRGETEEPANRKQYRFLCVPRSSRETVPIGVITRMERATFRRFGLV